MDQGLGHPEALADQPVYTPALLGSAVFYGLREPARLEIGSDPVLAYNGIHCLVFLLLGFVAASFARLSERVPMGWVLALNLTTFVLFHVFAAFVFFTEPIRAAIPLGEAIGATVLAVGAMTAYVLGTHPRLRGSSPATSPRTSADGSSLDSDVPDPRH